MPARIPPHTPLTLERLFAAHQERAPLIRERLAQFAALRTAPDELLLEELAFCIFAAGSSAEMGMKSVDRLRPLLLTAGAEEMAAAARGLRFPNTRSSYLFHAREFLRGHCDLRLGPLFDSFEEPLQRRRFLAETRDIKGIGYKEASHFLRNIGYRGYAILDKHILGSLVELGVLSAAQPPKSGAEYLDAEARMTEFALRVGIDPEEMDLLLWSEKTGKILK